MACIGPGGDLVGRFCRRPPSPRTRRRHADTGRLQVAASRFSPHPGLLLDASQRPSQSSQGYYLLSFRFAQDLAHATEATTAHVGINVPDSYFRWPIFQVTIIGRFWVTPEV